MKTLLVAATFAAVMVLPASAMASDFCDGFAAGYVEGYCYQEFACIRPIVPICPIPRIGESGFQDGYNRGFVEGVADKR